MKTNPQPAPRTQRWLGVLLLLLIFFVSGCSRSARASRHTQRAERFLAQQQYDLARLEYGQALKLDPRQPQALYRLGSLLYDRGQAAQAFALLSAAEIGQPKNVDLSLRLARFYLESNQPEQARARALKVLEIDPTSEAALECLARASLTTNSIRENELVVQNFRNRNGEGAAVHLALGYLAFNRGDGLTAQTEFARAANLDPGSGRSYLAMARLHWRRGDFKEAEADYRKAAEHAAGWETPLEWAEFRLRTGQTDGARQLAAELAKRVPGLEAAVLIQARAALAERKYDLSNELVDRVLRQDPKNPDALLVQAQIALAKGETGRAVSEFEALRDRNPGSSKILYQLALAYAGDKQVPRARESVQKALAIDPGLLEALFLKAELDIQQQDFGSAVGALEPLTERATNLSRAFSLLGDAYRGQGRLADSLAAYHRWQRLSPGAPEPSFLIGTVLQQQGKTAEARQAYETSHQLAPNSILPVEKLVELDLLGKDLTSALQRATLLATQSSNAPAPHLLLARIRLGAGQTNEAEAELTRALALNPEYDVARSALIRLYLRQNEADKALRTGQELVNRRPNDPAALLQLAGLQERTGSYSAARQNYEKVLAADPVSIFALNNLAFLCAEHLNDLGAAFQYGKKARELAPDNPSVADTLGWVLCRRGDFPWGLALLRSAAEKLGTDPEVQFHLGVASYMMGMEAEARAAFRRALELRKDFVKAADAQARLRILALDPEKADGAAIEQLKHAVAQDPHDVIALLRLASVAERGSDLSAALADYQQAAEASPKSVPILLRLSRFYAERERQPARALDAAKAAKAIAPEDREVARALGSCALVAGDYALAYRSLQQAIWQNASDPVLLAELARAAYGEGRVTEAIEMAKQSLQSGPGFSSASATKELLDLITAAQDPLQAEAADAHALQVLQARPGEIGAAMVHGMALQHRGKVAEAVGVFESILQAAPDFAPASRELAHLYLDPGLADERKAFAEGLRARKVFENDAKLSSWLGRAAYGLKDYEHAVQYLGESARSGGDAETYYELGKAQAELQHLQESRAALRKAVELGLSGKALEDAKRVLAEPSVAPSA